MNLSKAINIVRERVEIDRDMRDYSVESDYDRWCEEQCEALEVLIDNVELDDVMSKTGGVWEQDGY